MRRLRFNGENDEEGGELTSKANGRDSESAPVVQSKDTDAGAPIMHRVYQGVSSQSTTLVLHQQQQQQLKFI